MFNYVNSIRDEAFIFGANSSDSEELSKRPFCVTWFMMCRYVVQIQMCICWFFKQCRVQLPAIVNFYSSVQKIISYVLDSCVNLTLQWISFRYLMNLSSLLLPRVQMKISSVNLSQNGGIFPHPSSALVSNLSINRFA